MKAFLSQNTRGFFLWFGAAISIVDIMTGMQIAKLGLSQGFMAIFTGLAIGCCIFFCAGLIGAKEKLAGMQSTAIAYGKKGSLLFAFLNFIQLIGWTAVMLQFGALTAKMIFGDFAIPQEVWTIAFGLGVGLWVVTGAKGLNQFHAILIVVLFAVCVGIFTKILGYAEVKEFAPTMTFALAVDLALVLPLSWTPLIADYTKNAENPVKFTLTCALAYFIGSSCMFSLGLLGAYYLDLSAVVPLFALVGGTLALFVLFFSTVTTAYLDVYSAAESFLHVLEGVSPKNKISHKAISIFVLIMGTGLAIALPSSYFEPFLYFIASVFLPMLTILIFEYFLVKADSRNLEVNYVNIIFWLVGFIIYNSAFTQSSVLGKSSIILLTLAGLCIVKYFITKKGQNHAK